MYQRINSTQEKKPEAKDEKVHEEAELEEGLMSIQPADNEAANVELMDQMLKKADDDNNIIRNDTGSDISDASDLNIISTSNKPKKKKKPSKDDEKKALNLAEKIVKGQAPKNDDFEPLSTYALDEDMIVETGSKRSTKKKKSKKPSRQHNIVSIMIEQPKSGSAQAMNSREMGHAFLGIEYSRKSAISNRYERYKLMILTVRKTSTRVSGIVINPHPGFTSLFLWRNSSKT